MRIIITLLLAAALCPAQSTTRVPVPTVHATCLLLPTRRACNPFATTGALHQTRARVLDILNIPALDPQHQQAEIQQLLLVLKTNLTLDPSPANPEILSTLDNLQADLAAIAQSTAPTRASMAQQSFANAQAVIESTLRLHRQSQREAQNKFINAFWNTTSDLTFFNQIKSTYNANSASATLSTDLATLNFSSGLQILTGTNLQATPTPATPDTAAAQAAQNLLHGGSLYFAALFPLLKIDQASAQAGGFALTVNMVARQGIDIQNFKPTDTLNLTSPPAHSAAQLEGYAVFNATNPAPSSGSLFIGGSYGYAYSSHSYARNYNFGPRLSHSIAELSAGILINGIGRVSISRAFGPRQDSTDNFKSWSFTLTHQ